MQPAVLIRLRPLGPWRYGPGDGGNDRMDKLFRSDRLYSAVTLAMRQFGYVGRMARRDRARVQSTGCIELLVSLSSRHAVRSAAAHALAASINAGDFAQPGVPLENSLGRGAVCTGCMSSIPCSRAVPFWPISGCPIRKVAACCGVTVRIRTPFRVVMRTRAAIDRLSQTAAHVDSFACVEFEASSGLWCAIRFADAAAETQWSDKMKAAFRLLADTGFGGGRTAGWGQTAAPEFQDGAWPNLLLPRTAKASAKSSSNGDSGDSAAYWLLSLYSPAQSDSPDWSQGDYELVTRGGHSRKTTRMIGEGSVLLAAREPAGVALDVAPAGHEHPVYRAGFALAVRLPEITEDDIKPVEEPADEEAPEAKPCPEPAEQAEQSEETGASRTRAAGADRGARR